MRLSERSRRRLAVLVGSFAVTAMLAEPAMAVAWKSASNPLTAYHKSRSSGEKQAQAYGNFYNSGSTHARSSSYQRDNKPGGHKVYVETMYRFWYSNLGHPAAWHRAALKQTGRTSSGAWKSAYTQAQLHPESEKARGVIQVCEDQPNAPDDCSADAIVTFAY